MKRKSGKQTADKKESWILDLHEILTAAKVELLKTEWLCKLQEIECQF